jgi:hypothetical protein
LTNLFAFGRAGFPFVVAILAIYTGNHQRNGPSKIQGHVPKDAHIPEKPLD